VVPLIVCSYTATEDGTPVGNRNFGIARIDPELSETTVEPRAYTVESRRRLDLTDSRNIN
jgi:hypothetical protein